MHFFSGIWPLSANSNWQAEGVRHCGNSLTFALFCPPPIQVLAERVGKSGRLTQRGDVRLSPAPSSSAPGWGGGTRSIMAPRGDWGTALCSPRVEPFLARPANSLTSDES